MTTRFLSISDVDSIIELEDGFIDGWNKGMITKSFESGFYYAIGKFINEKLISYISYTITDDSADIDMVYTDSEYRRQGLAEELLNTVIENLTEKQIKGIFLEVREQNQKAIALYNKCGFTFVSVRKKYYADGENAIILKREI